MNIEKVDELFNRHGIDIFSDTLTKYSGFDTIMHEIINEVIETCAVTAWTTGMELHKKKQIDDTREVGSACAKAIRAI